MVESADAPKEKVHDPVAAEEKKNQGNEALKAGKTDEAISLYTEAIGKLATQFNYKSRNWQE